MFKLNESHLIAILTLAFIGCVTFIISLSVVVRGWCVG